jgi:flagellar motor switch protein FliN/FliY
VIALDELPGPKVAVEDNKSILANTNPLHAIKAMLQVCVGQTEITVGALIGARESDVLVLDRTIEDPVDLLLHGSVVARGLLVASEGRFAIRITELPLPLKP